TINGMQSTMNGTQQNMNGMQPTINGMQSTMNGMQPTINGMQPVTNEMGYDVDDRIDVMIVRDRMQCPDFGKIAVRFIHASAGTPPVDVYINDNKVVSNLQYGQEQGYVTVNSGDLDF